jgi:glycosyltransferase involved in cell wall biosynthesis
MIAPTPFFSDRGCHIRVLNSYLKLKNEGNEVTLLTYPIGRNINGVNIKRVQQIPGYKKTSPGFSAYKPFLDFLLLIKSIKEMKKERYDSIYSHLHEGAAVGIILKKFFKKDLTFDSQGSVVGELTSHGTIKKDKTLSRLLFKIEKYITKRADKIITSTEGLKNFIEANIKTNSPIEVIKDLPDTSLFNPNVEPAELNLPKDKKIVTYFGGLQEYKGINHLIKAIPLIDREAHFLIMGYPEEQCKKLAESLGVRERITFTGKVPYELAPSHLKLANIAVSPKTLESGEANFKIYNYLAMNLPVVCFDIPENRSILGEKGIYAKPKDIKDLALKINETIKSSETFLKSNTKPEK